MKNLIYTDLLVKLYKYLYYTNVAELKFHTKCGQHLKTYIAYLMPNDTETMSIYIYIYKSILTTKNSEQCG